MVKSGKFGGKLSGKFEMLMAGLGCFWILIFIIWNEHEEDTSLILRCVLFFCVIIFYDYITKKHVIH